MRTLRKPILATSIDDDEHARFPEDTELPQGLEFHIVDGRHPWPPRPDNELFYTIETRGARYNVAAGELEPAMD